jgi:arginine deiminase
VALRPGLVLGYSRNERTHEELVREAGYRVVSGLEFLTGEAEVAEQERAVIVFEGSELVRGGGGARCMTLPVVRDEP